MICSTLRCYQYNLQYSSWSIHIRILTKWWKHLKIFENIHQKAVKTSAWGGSERNMVCLYSVCPQWQNSCCIRMHLWGYYIKKKFSILTLHCPDILLVYLFCRLCTIHAVSFEPCYLSGVVFRTHILKSWLPDLFNSWRNCYHWRPT